MYIPAAFAETDLTKLHDFIEREQLWRPGVAGRWAAPCASHSGPFCSSRTTGPHGTLVGHMARANPQWQQAGGEMALAIFSGPHAYVSPTWYQAEQVVPTWNYSAVHAYGKVQVVEDKAALLDIVRRSVRVYERAMPRPWSFDGSEAFVERLLVQIVGFRIEIKTVEGKFKLNQNHPVERRRKVVRALQQRGDENALAVAAMMKGMLPGEG